MPGTFCPVCGAFSSNLNDYSRGMQSTWIFRRFIDACRPECGEESMKHKILLVDDQTELRSLLAENFKTRGYEVLEAADGTALKALFAGTQPDAVLLDLKLPDADGLDLLSTLKRTCPKLR